MTEFTDKSGLGLHGCHEKWTVKQVLLLFTAYDALTAMLEAIICYK